MQTIIPKRFIPYAVVASLISIAGSIYFYSDVEATSANNISSSNLSCGDKTLELEEKWKAAKHVSSLDAVLYCHIEPEQKSKFAESLKAELDALSDEQQFKALTSLPEYEVVNADLFFAATRLFQKKSHALVTRQEVIQVVRQGQELGVTHNDLTVVIHAAPSTDDYGNQDNVVSGYSFVYKGKKVGDLGLPPRSPGSGSAAFSNDQAEEFAKDIAIFKLVDGYLVRVPSKRAEGNYVNTFVRYVVVNSSGYKEISLASDVDFLDYVSNGAAALAYDSARTFYIYNGPVFNQLVHIETTINPDKDSECQAKIQSFVFKDQTFTEPTLKALNVPCSEEFDYPRIYDAANNSFNYAQQLLLDDKFAWLHLNVLNALGNAVDKVYGEVALIRLKDLKVYSDGKELEAKARKFLVLMNTAGVNPNSTIKAAVEKIASQAVTLSALPESPESLGYKKERFFVLQVISDVPGAFLANLVTTYQYPPKQVVISTTEVDQINHAGFWTLWAKQTGSTKIKDGAGFVTNYPLYAIATPATEQSATQHIQLARDIQRLADQSIADMVSRIEAANQATEGAQLPQVESPPPVQSAQEQPIQPLAETSPDSETQNTEDARSRKEPSPNDGF